MKPSPSDAMVEAGARALVHSDVVPNSAEKALARRVLTAALAAEPGGWRPIADAPRDARNVVLWSPDCEEEGGVMIGYRIEDDCYAEIRGYAYFTYLAGDVIDADPTHWQPLPSPPDDASTILLWSPEAASERS